MSVIVVGVDHSAGAKAALRFAREEAELRQATLRALDTRQCGYIGVTGLEGRIPAVGTELHEFRDAPRRPSMHPTGGDPRRGRRNGRHVVEGAPAAVLAARAEPRSVDQED